LTSALLPFQVSSQLEKILMAQFYGLRQRRFHCFPLMKASAADAHPLTSATLASTVFNSPLGL
jgi:hypothetical protein